MVSEQEIKELESYGDGVQVGIDMVLRDLKRVYDESIDTCHFGMLVQELMRGYGIEGVAEPEIVSKP